MKSIPQPPGNIDLWTVFFHYHWNWVAILVLLVIIGAIGIFGRRS